jgi:tRNA(Ile)-lysidine synthase|tara:strand:+ start:17476 stop:18471 length:996 start_codon:yes stop_codon:yes gene_type:complete
LLDLNIISNYIDKQQVVYVAFSGGIDSVALLYACSVLKKDGRLNELKAIHVNHNLSINAKLWEDHCINICKKLNIELTIHNIFIETNKDGLESAARKGRYDVFNKVVKHNEQLLLGHHADDVAETILFRLFRGTGIDGLQGPKLKRKIGEGTLIRPLLKFSKKELLDFITTNKIDYIEDESNKESNQDRNYIRNKIMPLIHERWQNSEKRIQLTSELIQEKLEIFNSLFIEKYATILVNNQIPLIELKKLKENEAKELFRYAINLNNIAMPSKKVLDEIMKTFYKSNPSKSSIVKWSRSDKEQKGGLICFELDFIQINGIEYSGMIKICQS